MPSASRKLTLILLGVLLALALVPTVRGDQAGQPTPDTFVGPGFVLDLHQWAPFYVEDGVYMCIIENGKFTCGAVAPGSVLLIPTGAPVDSTDGF